MLWGGVVYQNATEELISKVGTGGLEQINHTGDSSLQAPFDTDTTEYRYRGKTPDNYVTFNNETWRIIGVFPTDDGTGNIENRIKIIKDTSIGKKYWNSNGVNDWTTATLNTELNGTYYDSLTEEAKSMIGKTKYYLGGYNVTDVLKNDMYNYERKTDESNGGNYYYGSNPNSHINKIGIMYASDYGYAASDECTQTLYHYDNTSCKDNNWLYLGDYDWLLPQFASYSSVAFCVGLDGHVDGYGVSVRAVRPVLYLKSDVQITGGSGTIDAQYMLG